MTHVADPITILSLCVGYGGLDLGIELAVPGARVVGGVEWEASCASVLGAAMRGGLIPPFPVWSDLRSFDGRRWRGCVDILAAGYPCQPFSSAGKRRGADDERHLWPHVARVIGESEPECVFLENVEGHVGLGLRKVLRDLEAMGYRCAVGLFTARGVGAPHRRRRVFILGHRVADDHGGRHAGLEERHGEPERARHGAPRRNDVERCGAGLADTNRDRSGENAARAAGWGPDADKLGQRVGDAASPRHEQARGGQPREPSGRGEVSGERGERVGDTGIAGREGIERAGALRQPRAAAPGPAAEPGGAVEHAERADAGSGERGEQGEAAGHGRRGLADAGARPLWPPGPDGGGERGRWADIIAEFPEFAPATVESVVRGVADGGARRMDALRMLGNGVVPLEAAYAFVALWAALEHGGGDAGG